MAYGHHGGAWKVAFADFVAAIPQSRLPNPKSQPCSWRGRGL
ncbi:hypothetical protein FHR62_001761 [Xanthomonas arboricola]|nr:hypothetical protein [Xanthomonas arboricola]